MFHKAVSLNFCDSTVLELLFQTGSAGGRMVKKMTLARCMSFERADRTAMGHEVEVRYKATIAI
ncbi:MAG: hypothetical protein Q3995_02410 [Eubacteriales bacterium]|nr:hypothetical protein [Eubacteriales bacterium]